MEVETVEGTHLCFDQYEFATILRAFQAQVRERAKPIPVQPEPVVIVKTTHLCYSLSQINVNLKNYKGGATTTHDTLVVGYNSSEGEFIYLQFSGVPDEENFCIHPAELNDFQRQFPNMLMQGTLEVETPK